MAKLCDELGKPALSAMFRKAALICQQRLSVQQSAHEGSQTDTVRFFVRKAGGELLKLAMEVTCHGELPQTAGAPEKGGKQP